MGIDKVSLLAIPLSSEQEIRPLRTEREEDVGVAKIGFRDSLGHVLLFVIIVDSTP